MCIHLLLFIDCLGQTTVLIFICSLVLLSFYFSHQLGSFASVSTPYTTHTITFVI